MPPLELIIGNKNYSSWSLRPWIAMKVLQVPFNEKLVRLYMQNHCDDLIEHSPSKKVPVLKHGDLIIWDSLAILEYVAEQNSDKAFWPSDRAKRAHARSISNQMHAGFPYLRNECPMNMRRSPGTIKVSNGVKQDVTQIEALWRAALEKSGGPFLFGDFTIADAMYAPVVNRLQVYKLSSDQAALTYCNTITALPVWQEWATSAREEKWSIDHAEL
ncbi:MAG: glutathione S-transferase family protein [bacterium]|nr:glutathione S-transferase family protein [bacterium]